MPGCLFLHSAPAGAGAALAIPESAAAADAAKNSRLCSFRDCVAIMLNCVLDRNTSIMYHVPARDSSAGVYFKHRGPARPRQGAIMNRRSFFKTLAVAPAAGVLMRRRADAALPKAKITRVRIYQPPNLNQLFNQSNMVVTVETDIGITGIGEGGAKDTLEQCAGTLIGKNPFLIEAIWQEMYMAWFYPPGREKVHALGALDLALWDIKGKALNLPLHELLGGAVRNYCECYATGGVRPPGAQRSAAPGQGPGAQGTRPGDHGGGLSLVSHRRRRHPRGQCLQHA